MDERLREMFEIKGAEMSMPSTMSPEIRGKVIRKRALYGGVTLTAVAAALVALFVWSGATNDTTPKFAPADDADVSQPAGLQLDAGTMDQADRYAIDEFTFAPFSIEVAAGDEWQPKIWGPGMFEMGYMGTDGGFLTFHQEWKEVIDPEHALQGGVPAPSDLRGWFLRHPALDVANVTETQIDGYPATTFDVAYNGLKPTPCKPDCWQIAPASEFWGGTMFIREGEPRRLTVIQTPEGEVIAEMFGDDGFLDGPAAETLASVDFVD